jgi:hypothetical protein
MGLPCQTLGRDGEAITLCLLSRTGPAHERLSAISAIRPAQMHRRSLLGQMTAVTKVPSPPDGIGRFRATAAPRAEHARWAPRGPRCQWRWCRSGSPELCGDGRRTRRKKHEKVQWRQGSAFSLPTWCPLGVVRPGSVTSRSTLPLAALPAARRLSGPWSSLGITFAPTVLSLLGSSRVASLPLLAGNGRCAGVAGEHEVVPLQPATRRRPKFQTTQVPTSPLVARLQFAIVPQSPNF